MDHTSSSSSSAEESHHHHHHHYHPALLGVTATCCFIIGLVGTFGNLLIAISLLHSQKLRRLPFTYFIVNLPVSLIFVCAIGLPVFGIICIQQIQYDRLLLSEGLLVVVFVGGLTLTQVHIQTICAIAFNRLLAVKWPLLYERLMTPRGVTIHLMGIWIYSTLLWIPLSCGAFGPYKFNKEELIVELVDDSNATLKMGIHVLVTFILPTLFTSICYLVMYIKVRQIRRVTEESRSVVSMNESNVIRQWDDHVTRAILMIYVIFITCSVPHLIIHILKLHADCEVLWLLLHILFALQFCLDPIVYVIISQVYRKAVMEFLNKIFPHVSLFQLDDSFSRSEGRSDFKSQNLSNVSMKEITQTTSTKNLVLE